MTAGTTMTSYSPSEPRDGGHVAQRHRRSMRDDRAEHDQARHHHHVAGATLGADEPRQANRPGRARNVLDRRGVDDAGALQRLLHHAGGLIPSAAGRRRRNEAKVLINRFRKRGRGRRAEQNRKEHAQHGKSRHDCIVCERFSFAPNRSAKAFALQLYGRAFGSAKALAERRAACPSPIWCSAKALAERPCASAPWSTRKCAIACAGRSLAGASDS